MPDRELVPCSERVESLAVDGDPVTWLAHTARDRSLRYLLAFADDGVVWGRLDDDRLVTPYDHGVGAPLRAVTLQEARLFDEAGEVLLWRDTSGLSARAIGPAPDGEGPSWESAFDEPHLLWGTRFNPLPNGFTRLREGGQGLLHAPPLGTPVTFPAALRVRHYVSYAPSKTPAAGLARVAASRLIGLTPF